MERRCGIVICGAYGLGNAGDEEVLRAAAAALGGTGRPVTVLTRRPAETARLPGVEAVHPFRVLRWLRVLRRSELFVHGGGSLLQDVTSRRSLWFYRMTLEAARRCGCRVMLYGCGMGPLKKEKSRRETARTLNGCVDVITVRDAGSAEYLRTLGVTVPAVSVTADPALALPVPAQPGERSFGVALRDFPGFREAVPAFAAAVRRVSETYRLRPVFFCLGPGDREAARAVRALLGDRPSAVSADPEALGRMSLVLSVRLHGLLFALRGGVPAAGISYDPKVEAFCRDAGYPVLDTGRLSEEALVSLLDRAMLLDAEALRVSCARLREREKGNLSAAQALLEKRP